jgi:short-subunit dehydrogenase
LRKGKRMMTVEECSRKILLAAARRKREVILSTRGKFVELFKLLVPHLVDQTAVKAVREVK